jgi:hypothetical protein
MLKCQEEKGWKVPKVEERRENPSYNTELSVSLLVDL